MFLYILGKFYFLQVSCIKADYRRRKGITQRYNHLKPYLLCFASDFMSDKLFQPLRGAVEHLHYC